MREEGQQLHLVSLNMTELFGNRWLTGWMVQQVKCSLKYSFIQESKTLLDAIIAYPYAEEIKAFRAGNLAHFYIPDSPQDILHMILKSVWFLELDKVNQSKLQSSICSQKYTALLYICQPHDFSNVWTSQASHFPQAQKMALYCSLLMAGHLSPLCTWFLPVYHISGKGNSL